MHKKLFVIFALSLLIISIGCTSKNKITETKPIGTGIDEKKGSASSTQENVKSTGEQQVDKVGDDLSDVNTTQNELDDSGLNDVDIGLNDIEKV